MSKESLTIYIKELQIKKVIKYKTITFNKKIWNKELKQWLTTDIIQQGESIELICVLEKYKTIFFKIFNVGSRIGGEFPAVLHKVRANITVEESAKDINKQGFPQTFTTYNITDWEEKEQMKENFRKNLEINNRAFERKSNSVINNFFEEKITAPEEQLKQLDLIFNEETGEVFKTEEDKAKAVVDVNDWTKDEETANNWIDDNEEV